MYMKPIYVRKFCLKKYIKKQHCKAILHKRNTYYKIIH